MAKPLLCVTVTGATTAELRARRDAVPEADLIELRLDSVADPDVAGALAGRARPVIVTCRPVWEGGHYRGSEDERRSLLARAFELGAEYVDVEWRAGFGDLIARTGGRRLVLSCHDFDGVPSDLVARVRAMQSSGAQVVKIAVQTARLADCVTLLDVALATRSDGGLVVIGMGEHGLATRVLAGRLGSRWTYAGAERAVGQLTPGRLLDEFRFRAVTERTALYGVVGRPVSQSVSPAMHNAAFRAMQVDAVYLPLPATDVEDFVAFARAFGVAGASVTIPYKVALLDYIDDVPAGPRHAGAINTVSIVNGSWLGENTDVAGFLEPLQERVLQERASLDGLRAAILGAGGAARAVAVALESRGASVSVHARDRRSGEAVAALAGGRAEGWPPEPGSWDLLVNCTPVGMYPHEDRTPLPAASLTGRWVYDLVYNPATTRLLRDASSAGLETISGLEMLVAQARRQFTWWTGLQPPAHLMREAACLRLSEFRCDETHVV